MAEKPEDLARADIDRLLVAAGWAVQTFAEANILAACGDNLACADLKSE